MKEMPKNLGVGDEKELRMSQEFERFVLGPPLLQARIGHDLWGPGRNYSDSNNGQVERVVAYLKGLSNSGELDERFENCPFEEFLVVDLLLVEGVHQALALVGRQRERIVADGRLAIDQDSVTVVENAVLTDGGDHGDGQLDAEGS